MILMKVIKKTKKDTGKRPASTTEIDKTKDDQNDRKSEQSQRTNTIVSKTKSSFKNGEENVTDDATFATNHNL